MARASAQPRTLALKPQPISYTGRYTTVSRVDALPISDWTAAGREARWDDERHQWWIRGRGHWFPLTDSLMLDHVLENVGKIHPAHGADPSGAAC